MDDPKFGCEYAKSNRSACKLCKSCIGLGSLRLSIYVQSPFFDGKVPNWYHFSCFFKKKIPTDVSEIKGFESLRWEDQQKIRSKMGLIKSEEFEEEEIEDGDYNAFDDKENKSHLHAHEHSIDVFLVEYAKSARSKCRKCEKRINKDEIRFQLHSDGSFHLDCFAKNRDEIGFKYDPKNVPGFEELDEADQKLVIKELKVSKEDDTHHSQ